MILTFVLLFALMIAAGMFGTLALAKVLHVALSIASVFSKNGALNKVTSGFITSSAFMAGLMLTLSISFGYAAIRVFGAIQW